MFISLGAPGVDEYYGAAEDGSYFHRVIDTTAKRVVQVVMPRRGVKLAAEHDPFAVEVEGCLFDVQTETSWKTARNPKNLVNGHNGDSAVQEAEDWRVLSPSTSVTSSLADRRGFGIAPVRTKLARFTYTNNEARTTLPVVRAKHLDRGVSNDSAVASAITPQSSGSARSLPQERCCAHTLQAGSGQYKDEHQHDHWATCGGATGACPDGDAVVDGWSGYGAGASCCGVSSGEHGGGECSAEDYSRMSFQEEDSSPGTQLLQAALRRKQLVYSHGTAPLGDWYARGLVASYTSTSSGHRECFEQAESPGALVQRAAAKRRLAQAEADDSGRTSGRPATFGFAESPGRQIQRAATQRRRHQH